MTKDFNYRVLRRNGELAIYEVFYDEAGNATMCTENALSPSTSTIEGLRRELRMMLEAFDSPVLDYDQIANGTPDPKQALTGGKPAG